MLVKCEHKFLVFKLAILDVFSLVISAISTLPRLGGIDNINIGRAT